MGEKITALIEVKVSPKGEGGFNKIAEKIYSYSEVDSAYLVSGSYDFLVTIEHEDLQEIAHFVHEKLATIDGVIGTSTSFVLHKYKEKGQIHKRRKILGRMSVTP